MTVRRRSYRVGERVLCDHCDADWTAAPECGGMIFGTRAICPDCTPRWVKLAKDYGEERFIRAWCPPGMSFADFVRAYRGPDPKITVTSFDGPGEFFGS